MCRSLHFQDKSFVVVSWVLHLLVHICLLVYVHIPACYFECILVYSCMCICMIMYM